MTTKFLIEHTYEGIGRDEYATLFFDEPFNVALGAALHLGRSLVRLDRTPERIVRHVRCEPKRDTTGPAAKVLGNSSASYVDELEYDVAKYLGRWRTVSSVLPDKVHTSGTIEFVEVPGGVKRVVRGEMKVAIFGVGGLVEKFIVAEVEKSYAGAAEFTVKWLAKGQKG